MKRIPKPLTIGLLTTAAITTAVTAVPRPDAAKQPELQQQPAQEQAKKVTNARPNQQKGKPPVAKLRAFLGIYGNPISSVLRSQLGITGCNGVALEHIARNSPADKAGLQKFDIILRIDGKDVKSQNDIKSHIFDKKPGDQIKITYIRRTQQQDVAIELDGAPIREQAWQVPSPNAAAAPQGANPNQDLDNLGVGGIPPQILERMNGNQKQLLNQLLNSRDLTIPHSSGINMPGLKALLNNNFMFEFNGKELDFDKLLDGNGIGQINGTMKSSVRVMDGQGSLKLETENGVKTLTIYDCDGNTLFTGPYNTDDDKKAVPADLHKRVEKSGVSRQRANQFHLHLGR